MAASTLHPDTSRSLLAPSLLERDPEQQFLVSKARTYHHVLIAIRYVVLAHIVVGTFLVLAFCTRAGFWGGLFAALIELWIGLYFAKDGHRHAWPSEVATLFISTGGEKEDYDNPIRS